MPLDSCKTLASRLQRCQLDGNGAAYLHRGEFEAVILVEDLKLGLRGGDYPKTDSLRRLTQTADVDVSTRTADPYETL